jgi:hypothetical protein
MGREINNGKHRRHRKGKKKRGGEGISSFSPYPMTLSQSPINTNF